MTGTNVDNQFLKTSHWKNGTIYEAGGHIISGHIPPHYRTNSLLLQKSKLANIGYSKAWAETWRRVWGWPFLERIFILTPKISHDLLLVIDRLLSIFCLSLLSKISYIPHIYHINLYFTKNIPSSHILKRFLLSSTSHNTTSPNIWGRMHGPSPPQISGDRPPSPPLSLRPCTKAPDVYYIYLLTNHDLASSMDQDFELKRQSIIINYWCLGF